MSDPIIRPFNVKPESVKSLGHQSFNVNDLKSTAPGRSFLKKIGKWEDQDVENWHVHQRAYQQRRSRVVSGSFMGWDGEGYDINGKHQYVMICTSDGDVLENPKKGLRSAEMLEWVWQTGMRHTFTNHVMFGGSYDANMILGSFSYLQILRLAKTGKLWWDDWLIQYRPRKYLMITKIGRPRFIVKRHRRSLNTLGTVTIWDTIGFFQTKFVTIIQEWLPTGTKDVPKETLDFIVRMKNERSTFKITQLDEMRDYCIKECQLLRTAMVLLRQYAKEVGYCPTRWDGAGAMSTKMLKKNRVQSFMSRHSTDENWNKIHELSKYAYFGGRIEMVQYGIANKAWAHDIASAYPAAMVDLPCLAHGQWHYQCETKRHMTLYHLKWNIRNPEHFYPLPWRNEHRLVFFPRTGEGWYWHPEAVNLIHYFPSTYEIVETWSWHQECEHQPFKFVPDAFAYRQRLKALGNPAQVAIKLPLNGAYGKLAQQVGGKQGKPPAFHELSWAGMITSETRARIYKLAMWKPDAVVAFETDGLYATENLTDGYPTVNTGDLGSWDVTQKDSLVYVQSGLYFMSTGEKIKSKYRGLDPGTLEYRQVIKGWQNRSWEVETMSNRFRGMMTSTLSPERFLTWRQWVDDPRTIALTPQGKRCAMNDAQPFPTDDEPLKHTYPIGGGGMSTPHSLRWETESGVKDMDDPYYLADMEYDEEAEV